MDRSAAPRAMNQLQCTDRRISYVLWALPPLKPHTIRFGWCYSAVPVRRVRDDDEIEREKIVSPPADLAPLFCCRRLGRRLNNNTTVVTQYKPRPCTSDTRADPSLHGMDGMDHSRYFEGRGGAPGEARAADPLDLTCLWRKIRLIGDPEAKTWHIMRRQSFCAICGNTCMHKQRHRRRTTSLHTTVSFVTYYYRTHALLWVEHIRHIVLWVYIQLRRIILLLLLKQYL